MKTIFKKAREKILQKKNNCANDYLEWEGTEPK